MSRILFLLFLFFGFLFIYPHLFGSVSAQRVTATPSQFTNKDSSGVDVRISNLILDKEYTTHLQPPGGRELILGSTRKPDPSGTISFHFCPSGLGGYVVRDDCQGNTFEEGVYLIKVYEFLSPEPDKLVANTSFNVNIQTAGVIAFLNSSFTTTDDIIIKVSGINNGSYKILVDGKDPTKGGPCIDARNGGFELNLGKYYEGSHKIQIYTNERSVQHPLCGRGSLVTYGSFTISNTPVAIPGATPAGAGPAIGPGTTSPAGVVNIKNCKSKDDPTFNKDTDIVCGFGGGESCEDKNDGRGPAIKTAVGCVHTNPVEFVKDLMTWVLGIGGGLAFLMMLLGAFQILTSAGNPETLNAGRERLTSAVIGLLFVIFTVLLLQIIGFDILKIPGFGR